VFYVTSAGVHIVCVCVHVCDIRQCTHCMAW